jgi:hypothetical protein
MIVRGRAASSAMRGSARKRRSLQAKEEKGKVWTNSEQLKKTWMVFQLPVGAPHRQTASAGNCSDLERRTLIGRRQVAAACAARVSRRSTRSTATAEQPKGKLALGMGQVSLTTPPWMEAGALPSRFTAQAQRRVCPRLLRCARVGRPFESPSISIKFLFLRLCQGFSSPNPNSSP